VHREALERDAGPLGVGSHRGTHLTRHSGRGNRHNEHRGDGVDRRLSVEVVLVPEEKKQPPIPLVPMAQHTLSANVVFCTYGPAGFQLVVLDRRHAPVAKVGDAPINANFEVGRFQLTPAAVRQLEKSIADALQNFKNLIGVDLPTTEQMVARDQTTALERSLQQFKTPDAPPSDPDGE
jgi:hypothetical protein